MRRREKSKQTYLPTPSEIRRSCREIQREWTEGERRRRAGLTNREGWMPPVVELSENVSQDNVSEESEAA